MTVFDVAAALGDDHDDGEDVGIETLIVEPVTNNALAAVIKLDLVWSGAQYADVAKKSAYTVWTPKHFTSELSAVEQVSRIKARHVIWCTVPHITIPPVSHSIGTKASPGSRYFPYYARPWMNDAHFDGDRDQCLRAEARAIDTAIDIYNDARRAAAQMEQSETGTCWISRRLRSARRVPLHHRPQRSASVVDALSTTSARGITESCSRLAVLNQ
jgi:hypothetical protein